MSVSTSKTIHNKQNKPCILLAILFVSSIIPAISGNIKGKVINTRTNIIYPGYTYYINWSKSIFNINKGLSNSARANGSMSVGG